MHFCLKVSFPAITVVLYLMYSGRDWRSFTQTKIIQRSAVNIPLKNIGRCHTHTKISDGRTIKNVWLRGLLSYMRTWCSLVSNHRFIVVYLRFIFNCCARQPTRIKISNEYAIKKRWLRGLEVTCVLSVKFDPLPGSRH